MVPVSRILWSADTWLQNRHGGILSLHQGRLTGECTAAEDPAAEEEANSGCEQYKRSKSSP